MDLKAPASSLCLFKETRSDLESRPSSVIQIQLPSSSPFSVKSRQPLRVPKTRPVYNDEVAFSKHCLATSGSIYSCGPSRYPRNILWRVLQEQKVLELRSMDVNKSERETQEAVFTLQLHFSVPIKHEGVALVDAEDPNILNVFALTKVNEVYTCSISRKFFWNAAALEENVGQWCKIYKPATFSLATPHCLVSGGPLNLIISLADGRVLQLTRDKKDDGSRWRESVYGDGQWGSSLRGLVRWQGSNTVRYDGAILEQSTPLTMVVSPDSKHIFAVCLNHTLRVWNPNKAASVFTKDLLWRHREPHDVPKVMLDPANANVLQLFQATSGTDGDLYYAVTFSPHDFGEFKFLGIRDPDHGETGIRDLFPESTLKAPDPDPSPDSKAIWKVADFKINKERDSEGLEMWILMRSHRRYRLYSLRFDLHDLQSQWQDCWCVSASEEMEHQPSPFPSEFDPEDVTESWLNYLLAPGHYSETVLDTALSIYNSERPVASSNSKASLRMRMYSAVASRVDTGTAGLNIEKYRSSAHDEWTRLYQDIQDLNKLNWNILSLAHDNTAGLPWIVFADGSSVVRSCSRTEIIAQNIPSDLGKSMHMLETPSVETENGEEPNLPDELAVLIAAAAKFRTSFSHRLRLNFKAALATELWLGPSYAIPLRMQAFYDQCNFAEDVNGDQFKELTRDLEALGGFDNLGVAKFEAIIDTFSHDLSSTSSGLQYTNQGLRTLINGAREMISLRERVLADLLALVTVIDLEVDREETPMENFDGSQIYAVLLDLLKRYQIMQWLVTRTRAEGSAQRGRSPQSKVLKGKTGDGLTETSTILESIFARDLKPQSTDSQSQSEALTNNIQDLLQWVVGGNSEVDFDDVPVYIQCDLLKHNDLDLATDFFGYQPSTAWSTYIKGRFYLMKDRPSEAAIHFTKAAFKLSRPSKFDYIGASNTLLTPSEAAHFAQGLPSYYAHITHLFHPNNPTQTAQFTHLALQLHPPDPTPLLTTLFHASLATHSIPAAYSALLRHPSPLTTLLPTLITTLLCHPTTLLPHLLSLPFSPHFHAPIDDLLVQAGKPKILAAWRMHHEDFQGAAAALVPGLLKGQRMAGRGGGRRKDERVVEEGFLSVINLLAVAGEGEGWVFCGGREEGVDAGGLENGVDGGRRGRRKVVTLEELRGGYQRELDRRSVIESGRYDFGGSGGGGEAMDVS